ncbi:MAG: hypothetical protein ACTSXJ_05130 [Candidatus Baldrarchaeia archaeon]
MKIRRILKVWDPEVLHPPVLRKCSEISGIVSLEHVELSILQADTLVVISGSRR